VLTAISLFEVETIIYRDDLNHPTISGNKLHKLTPNVELAMRLGCSSVLSFGGAYSNHLHALAWACKKAGLQSIGVVRGELATSLTPTLTDCRHWGMQLIPLPRQQYRAYQELLYQAPESCLLNDLNLVEISHKIEAPSKTLVVPEGGSNLAAIKSLSIAYERVFESVQDQGITHAVCATGTGATLSGLYQAAPKQVNVIGMQAVAERNATLQRVQKWLSTNPSRLTIVESHLGGFGKMPVELMEFINDFEAQYAIPLDPIYTGKALYKLSEMAENGYFKKTDKILFIHTGGLQGKRH